MNYNEQYFDKAMAQLEVRRSRNREQERLRREEVRRKLPEYKRLEELLSDTSRQLISLIINDRENAPQKLEQLEKNNLEIQASMNALLRQGGFAEDYLKPIYTCPLCHDKGSAGGKWCECFRRMLLNAAAEELNSISPLKLSTFDSFKTDYYSNEKDQTIGASPRVVMQRNLDFCRGYAEEFTTKSCGILMTGATGLGKTHLSLAIANRVIQKGYNVIYGSAPELLRTLEREYFGKSDNDTMAVLTACDLLVLDDLGAEMEKPLYNSLVYELINSRVNRALPTIVSSNLSPALIQARYQDRIWSRLFSFEVLMFIGSDVRHKLQR